MANENGKWVTISGRHVFIKDGQSPMDAFIRSKGKSQKRGNTELTNNEIKKVKTQKALKELAEDGKAIDITNYDDKKTRALDQKHGRLERVQITKGVYGMNGALLRSNRTGEYFVITARNGNLFYWV